MKASTWKTVRVFISSTFRDMQAERDWLVKRVFPALRQRLETHRIHLVDIDLRWGITRQQADNDQVLALCLQQIDDCRPFFLGLLGGRYGWVPSKFPVEVGKRYGWTQRHTGKSVTELEILHGVLNDPAMHRRALFCFRSDRCLASIANEQQRRVFVEGATEEELRELGREEAERRAAKRRNQLQELKQRIKKLSPPMPLFDGYPCLWQPGSSQREEALTSLPKPVTEKNEPHDVGRYGRVGRIVGLTEFGNWVIEKLEQAILNAPELQEHLIAARTETRDELAEERDFHERFIENRTRFYIGRQQLQDELKAFVTGTEAKPCLVTGPSGSGKSAALATFVGVWRTQNPQEVVIPHFVGASPRSTNLREMLRHLCAELKDAFTLEDEIKQDVRELSDQFREFLNNVPADRRVLLVLDALNQLDETDNAHSLYCLPTQMPPQVRLIVSCIDDPDRPDQQALVAMRHRTPHEIKVGLLTDDERLGILCGIPSVAAKTLDTNQIGLLLQNPATKNPLFLLVALEELRGFGSFEELNRRIAGLPQTGDTLTAIFHQVIRRLDEDFNEVTVKKVLTLLACSRRGLSERELLDLIEGDQVRIEESAGDLFPILRQLRPYMQSRGPLLDFYHRHLAKAIHEEFFKEDAPLTPSLSPSDEQRVSAGRGEERSTASSEVQGSKRPSLCQTTHQRLADYFARCAKGIDSAHEWETDSVRGFAECVFHFSRTGGHDQAVGLLTSFPFLLHKLRVGLLEGLFEDYGILYREAPSDVAKRLEVWAAFFREKAHILRRGYEEWPAHKILLQLAVEHADDSPVTQDAERWLAKRRCDWVWLRRNWRLERTCVSPCVSVLEGHSSTSKGLAIITDGGGRAATIGGALVLRDHRIISWANNDSNLRIWDPNDGRCLAVLEGHSGMVCGARTFADGRILSWASDYTLRLWDNINCTCMHVFEGHRNVVEGALVLPDGRILSWARTMFESTLGKDNTLRIWDANSGNCLTIFTGHATEVRGALVLPNDRILSWEKDNALQLWDRNSGKRQAVLHGHTSNVKGAVALLDGTLLSWADEPTLRLWDASTAKCLAVLEGHSGLVRGALSLSGGRILSWCGDHTLRLWDSRNRKCLAVLQGHANPAVGALTLEDGRILSWSQDHTLRTWDSSSGECLTVLDGHTSCVNGALVLTGGDILSWSSDRTLRRWDSNGGKCLAVLEGHSSKVHGALALPDGKVASWADQEDTLRLWDARSQNCVVNREGHSEKVNGALAMRNEKILSWAGTLDESRDCSLRIWEVCSGRCIAVLKGHSGMVKGALLLSDRIISWADENCLRLWDTSNGKCLAVLEGHSDVVNGALALPDGKVLSWAGSLSESKDHTLRIWDAHSGKCIAVLEGHSNRVSGALALADGRIVSWGGSPFESQDNALRLWHIGSGKCLAVLEGHSEWVFGALALHDSRILSWGLDTTLRIWDLDGAKCDYILKGHSTAVEGAISLSDDKLLSWAGSDSVSSDNTLRLWDALSGSCLEIVSEDEAAERHPEWLYARGKALEPNCYCRDFFTFSSDRAAYLCHKSIQSALASWHPDSFSTARCLLSDGTAVVTQDNGQVCILNLYHGDRRISLSEVQTVLPRLCRRQENRILDTRAPHAGMNDLMRDWVQPGAQNSSVAHQSASTAADEDVVGRQNDDLSDILNRAQERENNCDLEGGLEAYDELEFQAVSQSASESLIAEAFFGRARILKAKGRQHEALHEANTAYGFARLAAPELASRIDVFRKTLLE